MSDFPRHLMAIALAGLIAGTGVQAGVYKWTDENGQIVYSQTPPPSGNALKLRKPPEPDPAEVERAREELRQELERSYDQEIEKEQVRKEQKEKKREDEIRAKNCETARKNLYTIENLGRRRVLTASGEPVFLTDEERESQINQAQAEIAKFCN